MNNRTTFVIILSFVFILFSFTSDENSKWQEYKDIQGVKIYTKTAMCKTEHNTAINEYFVFKYVNSNSYDIRISWKLNIWYNDICRSCDLPSPNEYELSLDIKAGQTLEFNCTDDSKAFKIFKASEEGDMHPKVKFELQGLKLIKL